MTTTTTPTTGRPRTALRLGHTRELLTLLPHQLGFHPRDSVVLVALRPPGRGVGLVARIDLADLLTPDGPDIAASAVGHLAADDAREVVVVVYGDEADPRDPGRGLRVPPRGDAARAAAVARAAGATVGPVTVWYVAGGRYLGLDCRERGCCPPGGRPLADLTGGELAGRLMGRGEVAASREDVGAIASAAPGPRRAAASARSRWCDALLRADDGDELLGWRRESLAEWRAALAAVLQDPGALVPVTALGRLEAALPDRVLRDAVVLTLVAGDDDLPDALLRAAPAGAGRRVPEDGPGRESEVERAGEELRDDGADEDEREVVEGGPVADASGSTDVPDDSPAAPDSSGPTLPGPGDEASAVSGRVQDALDLVVDPRRGREPDDALAAAARTLLQQVVAHGRRERQAPALTVLALLAWWTGDAVRASVLVERALRDDPGHRLAELLDRALGAGLPPGWLRRRC
ncbi:DUF4192 family protein [Cellulomonas sp. Marseille-Q8402]